MKQQKATIANEKANKTWEDDGDDDIFASDVEEDLEGDAAVIEDEKAASTLADYYVVNTL